MIIVKSYQFKAIISSAKVTLYSCTVHKNGCICEESVMLIEQGPKLLLPDYGMLHKNGWKKLPNTLNWVIKVKDLLELNIHYF